MAASAARKHFPPVAFPALVHGLLLRGALATAEYDPDKKIESANLYGNVVEYGYYFLDMLVGTPANQRASVIVDTGSRLVGFPCAGCQHCGNHLDKAFDISSSQTAKWVGCDDSACDSGCFEDHCSYAETYSEGSSIAGFLFEDEVQLGDPLERNPRVKVRLGCHMNENNLFYTQKVNGIMGLAPSDKDDGSGPTILTEIFADRAHVQTSIFSMCLATWGGRMTIGGYNTSYHTGEGDKESHITWIRLRPAHYYFVFPVAGSVGAASDRERLSVASSQKDFGVTILDSGTTFTYFPGPLYKSILLQLANYCGSKDGCGGHKVDIMNDEGSECWQVYDTVNGPVDFPSIGLHFAMDKRVDWYPREYLQKRDQSGIWCATFLENNVFQTILGISFMLRRDIIFDITNERLGMAEAECPENRQPPPAPDGLSATIPPGRSFVPHRLYSIDDELAASLGYLPLGGAGAAPVAVFDRSAAVARSPRQALATAGALSLLISAALLGVVHFRSRRQAARSEEKQPLTRVPSSENLIPVESTAEADVAEPLSAQVFNGSPR